MIAVIVAGACAAIAGVLIGIPVLRLKGDYLAIVTLAFGEIIKNILNNLYIGVDGSGLHMSMKSVEAMKMSAGTVIVNGPMGAVGISKLSTFFTGICAYHNNTYNNAEPYTQPYRTRCNGYTR